MKVHFKADYVAHGGPPFKGPTDKALVAEDVSAVAITYSYMVNSWVIAGPNGEIYAEGEPAELADWMTDYLIELQREIDLQRLPV